MLHHWLKTGRFVFHANFARSTGSPVRRNVCFQSAPAPVRPLWLRVVFWSWCGWIAFALTAVCSEARGNDNGRGGGTSIAASGRSPQNQQLHVGLAQTVKIGHWNSVRWQIDETARARGKFLEIRALDSDSVPVWYRAPLNSNADSWCEGLAYLGRPRSSLELRVVDDQGETLAQADWGSGNPTGVGAPAPPLASTARLLLSLGMPIRRDEVVPAGDTFRGWEFRHQPQLDLLPTMPLAYDPVDCVVWNLNSVDAVRTVSPDQIEALRQWVESGGHLVLSVPDTAAPLFQPGGRLESLAPGTVQGAGSIRESDSLEFYAQPANQLIDSTDQELPVCLFEPAGLPVEVRQDAVPLVIRRPLGFGRITTVAFDVGHPRFVVWNGRARFLHRVLGWGDAAVAAGGASHDLASRYGFSDLSGQLRGATEQFRRVQLVSFTTIALLVGLYILCIGPGDYFFLRHVVQRMELTWLTLALVTAAFGALSVWIVSQTRPRQLQVNQVEVIDIDGAGQAVRGTTWVNVYSPRTVALQVSLPATVGGNLPVRQRALHSFGLAGRGLGGMQNTNQTPLFHEPYRGVWSSPITMQLEDVPIAIAATKPLTGRWTATHAWQGLSDLRYQPRVNRLSGRVRNPLDRELRRCFLLYGNRAYALDRIPAGGTVDIAQGVERSLKVFLQAGQGDVEAARWRVADLQPAKIVEMMMFYEAAGGIHFTGLTNDLHAEVDLSAALELGRAVLVGRIEGHLQAPIEIDHAVPRDDWDQQLSMVRILLPVEQVDTIERLR